MRKVTTEYRCDSCSTQVETARDLARFALERVNRGRKFNERVTVDLCDDCEARLLAAVEPFITLDQLPDLHGMRREET